MNIEGATALVTGANRGLGRAYAEILLERGAAKVYAAARDPRKIDVPGVEAIELDLLDKPTITAAAGLASDVDLLINNAGVTGGGNLLTGDPEDLRREMDVNFYGTLEVTRAFAPVLAANGGGVVVNMLSALSFFAWDGATGYAASKAAEWMLTNATRIELAGQGTLVVGVALGAADTDMMAGYEGFLLKPADVVNAALDGVVANANEVFVDDWSRMAKDGVAADPVEFAAKVAALFA